MRKTIVTILMITWGIMLASEDLPVNSNWLTKVPEVLTYSTHIQQQDEGYFQISSYKTEENITVYINIISNNFTKTVSGTMNFEIYPISSDSKIITNNGVIIDTNCNYQSNKLDVITTMKPYNQNVEKSIDLENRVVDHSQIPTILRFISLNLKDEFTFDSFNPQTNVIVPLTIKVLNEEVLSNIDCLKVEMHSFEGQANYWIEKVAPYRILKIEQPESGRMTELIF